MAKRIGGFRRKTRYKFKKKGRKKGKLSLQKYFQIFNPGDRVYLTVESSVHKGMYYPPYSGKTGIIKSKRGSCYEVSIKDMNKEKVLIVHPIHLKKM